MMRLFDSHAHLIADNDALYPPAPLLGQLRDGDLAERFTAERMLRLMDEAGVERICAVQRAHVYGYDNRYVIDSAARYPDRMLAVVAIDANSPSVAEDVRRWVDQGAVGIRFAALTPQVDNNDWFASPNAMKAWEAAENAGTSICLHVFKPQRLPMLATLTPLLDRFAGVKVVIDHISSAGFDVGPPTYGVDEALTSLRDKPNVFFKLTTINLRRTIEAGQPTPVILERLVSQLGADKIMWGSDIAQTKGSYPDMVCLLRQAADGLGVEDRDMVFTGSWQAVYGVSASIKAVA